MPSHDPKFWIAGLLMVTSATYRQSSNVRAADLARDPENRWLGRAPTFRLEAGVLRDAALLAGSQGGVFARALAEGVQIHDALDAVLVARAARRVAPLEDQREHALRLGDGL